MSCAAGWQWLLAGCRYPDVNVCCCAEATLWTFICYFIVGYYASSARIIMFWAIM